MSLERVKRLGCGDSQKVVAGGWQVIENDVKSVHYIRMKS